MPEGLPRNASMKILRRVLRERCARLQEQEVAGSGTKPRARL